MGVIDLDARVKKLESGESGGVDPTVIDQLEAAVTALEETVNGDGETDLGLVGDVAALSSTVGDLIEDVSDKFTPNDALTFADGDPEVYIVRIGNMCFLHIKASITTGASAVGSETVLGTLDESIRPEYSTSGFCIGEVTSIRSGFISTLGVVQESGGNWCRLEAFWKIATPAPTP